MVGNGYKMLQGGVHADYAKRLPSNNLKITKKKRNTRAKQTQSLQLCCPTDFRSLFVGFAQGRRNKNFSRNVPAFVRSVLTMAYLLMRWQVREYMKT